MGQENKNKNNRNGIKYAGIISIAMAILLIAAGILKGVTENTKFHALVFAASGTSESEAVDDSESGTESESESESESELESESGSEGESESESESGSEGQSESESELKSDIQLESESELESAGELEMNAEEITETGTAVVQNTEQQNTEPLTEMITETITEINTEPSTVRMTETVTEISTEPTTEVITELITEIGTEPLTEAMTEPVTENLTEPSTETLSEPVTEISTEALTEPLTETAAEKNTELMTETASEKNTELMTETAAEKSTELMTETVTEKSTEAMTEVMTEYHPPEPQKIERGKHYEIKGNEGAWYRDGKGHLWIRRGTDLYIETKNESGFNSKGTGLEKIEADGVLTFQLQKTDSDGTVLAVSEMQQEAFLVDASAPEAEIVVNGNVNNGIIFAAQQAEAMIQIPPDGGCGLQKAEYCITRCTLEGAAAGKPGNEEWKNCENGQSVLIDSEGIYRMYVRTRDQVGNQEFAESTVICVDRTPPKLSVEGVGDQTANSDKVQIKVSCEDSNYRQGSLEIQIIGNTTGNTPAIKESGESVDGAFVSYFDFPESKSYDDIYTLHLKALDLAGNQSEKEIKFSVNRYGSVYDLSEETKDDLEQYYLQKACPVVFYETNIDYVGESNLYCRRDGEVLQLKRGQDYQVSMQGSSDSWKKYQYMVPAAYFSKEGIYEMLLSSKDHADNQSDTGIQKKQVVFVLDWSAPGCMITGVEPGGIYDSETVTACLVPGDNFNIEKMRIYIDSSLLAERKVQNQEMVKLTFDALNQWRTLQVYLCDKSGNEYWSEEIPFFVRNNKEEVLPYTRQRESAEEQMKRVRMEELSVKEGLSFSGVQTDLAEKKTEVQTEENQEELMEAGTFIKRVRMESDSARGILLLAAGAVIFLITTVIILWSGRIRKK